MKDIHTSLRTLFYTLITGQGLVCYESGAIPDTAQTPYVIIADISTNERSNKTGFGNSVQTLLDVVTSFEKNKVGNSKLADTIAGQIFEVINSKIKFDIFDGLQIVSTKVVQATKITPTYQTTDIQASTKRVYRRLIRFQQLIMEV